MIWPTGCANVKSHAVEFLPIVIIAIAEFADDYLWLK